MGKTAIITGAASGFGLEFSKFLAEDSYELIMIDIDGPGLKKVKQEFEKKYAVRIDVIACDLSKTESISRIYQMVKDKPVDVLINNAGYGLCGFFNDTNWQIEEDMISLQVLNLTHLTKLILNKMIERGMGRIMNVSSVAGFQPGPFMAVYYAIKAYILSFTTALSNEVKGTGVTVTVFCPGQTKTNFQQTVAALSGSRLSSSGPFLADLNKTARYGYDAMMSGKPIAVPGMINKLIVKAGPFIPRKWIIKIVRWLQKKIRE
jgi:uncharacterized protein